MIAESNVDRSVQQDEDGVVMGSIFCILLQHIAFGDLPHHVSVTHHYLEALIVMAPNQV